MQLASVVLNEGDEANTTDLSEVFQHTPTGKRRKTAVKCAVDAGGGKEGVSWKNVEKEPYLRRMWEQFSCERSKAKKFRELADEEKLAGIQGQWQQESPARENLEQVKCCHDTDCNEPMMKKGFTALKSGHWEEYNGIFRTGEIGKPQEERMEHGKSIRKPS